MSAGQILDKDGCFLQTILPMIFLCWVSLRLTECSLWMAGLFRGDRMSIFFWSVDYAVKFHRPACSSDIDSWFDVLDIIAPALCILVRLYLTLQSDFWLMSIFSEWFARIRLVFSALYVRGMQGSLLILIHTIFNFGRNFVRCEISLLSDILGRSLNWNENMYSKQCTFK